MYMTLGTEVFYYYVRKYVFPYLMKYCAYAYVHVVNVISYILYIHILYFAWTDQRDRVCFIFHEVARVLYGK